MSLKASRSRSTPDKALGSSAFVSGVPVEVAIERSQQKRVVTRENVPGAMVPGAFFIYNEKERLLRISNSEKTLFLLFRNSLKQRIFWKNVFTLPSRSLQGCAACRRHIRAACSYSMRAAEPARSKPAASATDEHPATRFDPLHLTEIVRRS